MTGTANSKNKLDVYSAGHQQKSVFNGHLLIRVFCLVM
jgi:hypothetical protein